MKNYGKICLLLVTEVTINPFPRKKVRNKATKLKPFPLMKKLFFLSLITIVFPVSLFSQTDTAFWFAVPFATPDHDGPVKASLVITMHNYGDTVVVEQPAAPASFSPIKIPIAANTTYKLSLDAYMFNTTANTIDSYPTGAVSSTSWNGTNPRDNNGLHIHSKHLIEFNCYYEQDPKSSSPGSNNPDIWVLKGKNGLGTEFYIPFETTWTNQNFSNWPAYSSFDIVATKPNTTVTITPSKVDAGGHAAGVPYTVTLNAGQTFSVAPKLIYEKNGAATFWYAPSRLPTDRLDGSHVTADQPIAITIKDDSDVKNTAYDTNGDQLVPLVNIDGDKVIGKNYIVMRGKLDNLNGGENVYITTTANNTDIIISKVDGTDSTLATGLAAGVQVSYNIPLSKTAISVRGTKPIYVYHVSGFVNEIGGALIPSIDGCTGSLEVSFVRSIGSTLLNCNDQTQNNLFLNIMTKVNAIDSFYIQTTSGGIQKLGNASWFQQVGTTGWYALKDMYKCFSWIPSGTTVKVWNTEDVFHLGLINGVYSGGGCRYGYFSNYNEIKAKAVTIQTGTNLYTNCELDTVQLEASGGIMGRYQWFPTDYLIDPPTIANPRAVVPRGWTDFYCKIKQPCFGFDTLRVTVYSPLSPFAFFTLDKSQTCYSDTVFTITNKSENATKYRWTFGDGSPIQYYSASKIKYSYTNRTNAVKIFPIYLETENADGCLSSFKTSVTVKPYLKAGFTTAPDTIGCHPLKVSFTNTSNGNVTDTTYIWNFGDNNSTDDKSPTHVFENFNNPKDTAYTVRMVATSPFNCTDTAWQNITIHPYIKASFTVDTVAGCSPLIIKIHNNSDGAIYNYNWDFGDGTTRSDKKDTLIHLYPSNTGLTPIKYKLLLTVKNNSPSGCPDTLSRIITVNPQTTVSFTLSPKKQICDSTMVAFTTTPSAAVTSYSWNFGDGNTSNLQSPTHLYRNLTNKDTANIVTLTVRSNQFCDGFATDTITVYPFLDPQFSITDSTNCTPFFLKITNASKGGISKYDWDFGDGSVHDVTQNPPKHYYTNTDTFAQTKNLKLVIQNSGGCKDSLIHPVLLYPAIHAQFTPPPLGNASIGGCNPMIVNFVNQSYPPEVAKTYYWQFGDGTSSLLVNDTHTFTNTTSGYKTFSVSLTATSRYNCESTFTRTIQVYPYINADFTVGPKAEDCSPLTVTIDNTSTGGITDASWIIGGVTQNITTSSFQHTFVNRSGGTDVKQIRLVVQNERLCSDTLIQSVTIYPEVKADFLTLGNITEGCNELTIGFRNRSHYTNQATILPPNLDYKWSFGDSATSLQTDNLFHTFINRGNLERVFKTKLLITSSNKCTDDTFRNITVFPYMKARFSADNPNGCSIHTVNFIDSSNVSFFLPRNRYYWSFGDGQTSTVSASRISHPYRNLTTITQTYSPRLIVAYNSGTGDVCNDTIIRPVTIYPEVKALFTQDTLRGCYPLTIHFSNTSLIGSGLAAKDSLKYTWKYGDNGTAFFKDVSHTYVNYTNDSTTFKVKMNIISSHECADSIIKTVTVYAKPKAHLNVDDPEGCAIFNVPLDNESEAGDKYHWIFGDDPITHKDTLTTFGLGTTIHPYDNSNTVTNDYDLTMYVETKFNCWDTIHQSIRVYPHVNAVLMPDTAGCHSLTVKFKNYTTGATSYKWNFGDGVQVSKPTKTKEPTHEYYNTTVNDSTFHVSLIGYSDNECSDTTKMNVTVYPQPIADFDIRPQYLTYPANQIALTNQTNTGYWSYLWDYNDGLPTDTVKDPLYHDFQHWGHYDVSLKAWNAHCRDSMSYPVTIFPPIPIPDFETSEDGCVPLTVTFTDKSTWVTSWLWDFYDTETSTEQNPVHTFTKAGTYKVKLTVTGDGGSAYVFNDVIVFPKPVVDFTVKPELAMLSVTKEAPVQFYNKSNLGAKFLWEFGDSIKSDALEPSHIYRELGVYTVKLNVWTDKGCYASLVKPNLVTVLGQGVCEFPNAFTPNTSASGDGSYSTPDTKNEVFHPYWEGVTDFHLEIYARWGEKLFESSDVNVGWNGYYKGQLCKTDVYIWKAKGKFTNGATFEKAGNVTLLR
jgi:PKD repeat protein